MSVYNMWSKEKFEPKLKSSLSSQWEFDKNFAYPKTDNETESTNGRSDPESLLTKFQDLFQTSSTDSMNLKPCAFDSRLEFFDEDEYLSGANLTHSSIAYVGNDMTKLVQMAQEPWPDSVKLFQPYEVEQILLPDNASCLAVQAFLKMCNLPFEVEMRWNAEFMSPSGRVPFIRCGAFVVSELEPIVQFCGNKGATLCQQLTVEEKAEMRAYMSLITNVLVNAELYVSWLDRDTYNSVTRVRNSSVYPWPLGWIQTRSKRAAIAKRLKALHWHEKTLEQVLSDVEQCCNSLSQRLGDREYFFGTPTPIDALMYGHIRALLAYVGPKAHLFIRPITTALLMHTVRMAALTEMRLKPQEEYLISQALMISNRPVSPLSQSSTRSRRARHSDFKPFASSQLRILTSNDAMQCPPKPESPRLGAESGDGDLEQRSLANELTEDLMSKVEESSRLVREMTDFEVIIEDSEGNEGSGGLNSDVDSKSYEIVDGSNLKSTTDSEEQVIQVIEHRIGNEIPEHIIEHTFGDDKPLQIIKERCVDDWSAQQKVEPIVRDDGLFQQTLEQNLRDDIPAQIIGHQFGDNGSIELITDQRVGDDGTIRQIIKKSVGDDRPAQQFIEHRIGNDMLFEIIEERFIDGRPVQEIIGNSVEDDMNYHIIQHELVEETCDNSYDADGLVNEKHLEAMVMTVVGSPKQRELSDSIWGVNRSETNLLKFDSTNIECSKDSLTATEEIAGTNTEIPLTNEYLDIMNVQEWVDSLSGIDFDSVDTTE